MCKAQMKSGGGGILGGAVWPVGKLEGVECGRESGDDVLLYQSLKALYITSQRELVLWVSSCFFGTGMVMTVLKQDDTCA